MSSVVANVTTLSSPDDLSLLNMVGVRINKLYAVTVDDQTTFWIYEAGAPGANDKPVAGDATKRFRQTEG